MKSLASLLARTYPSPEWALFFEVFDATGGRGRRRADAVALGIWPSRGFSLLGFEFKEDRSDWLREKARPEKADLIASKCDQFWVVAGHDGVVKLDELPEPWGLLVASTNREKLVVQKRAASFAHANRQTIERSFVASMLRKVSETTVPAAVLEERVATAVQDALDRTREGYEIKQLREQVARLEGERHAFKAATGVELNSWDSTEKIAAAVAAVMDGERHRRQIERTRDELIRAAAGLSKALAAWPTPAPVVAQLESQC